MMNIELAEKCYDKLECYFNLIRSGDDDADELFEVSELLDNLQDILEE